MNDEDITTVQQRLSILRAIELAVNRRDEVFAAVDESADAGEARLRLSMQFDLSEQQALAVLSLQVSQWTQGMSEWRVREIARCEETLGAAEVS